MIFRQLFEPLSSTYTYMIGCEVTRKAILIDPVVATLDRDLLELNKYGLTLEYAIDTHIHADHITSALELKKRLGSKIANPIIDRLPCADIYLEEDKPLSVGSIQLVSLHTPGHTAGHFSYMIDNHIYTGDSLLIDGCGRTDFQNGSAEQLYNRPKLMKSCVVRVFGPRAANDSVPRLLLTLTGSSGIVRSNQAAEMVGSGLNPNCAMKPGTTR